MRTTRIGTRHQITIPKEVFETLHLEVGDFLEVGVTEEGLLLIPKKLISKDQACFWTKEWQQKEKEADIPIDEVAYFRLYLRLQGGFSTGTTNQVKLISMRGGVDLESTYGGAGSKSTGDKFPWKTPGCIGTLWILSGSFSTRCSI